MTDYILIEKIWQDIFCYQVKITCASSHVVATNDIYISDDSIDTLFNGLNDFIKGKTKEFFWENGKKGDEAVSTPSCWLIYISRPCVLVIPIM